MIRKNFSRIDIVKEYALLFKTYRQGIIGLSIILIFIILAVSAPLLTIYDPLKLGSPDELLQPPNYKHILGTDDMGRDIFSQLVYGARISLLVGFSAAFISILIGSLLGLVAGYMGGYIDEIIMRITDIVMVLPALPLMIVLSALLGRSLVNIILVISVVGWPYSTRVIRSQVLTVKERPFIEAAKCLGAGSFYILFREIFPNVREKRGKFPILGATAGVVGSIQAMEVIKLLTGVGEPLLNRLLLIDLAFNTFEVVELR